MTKAQIVHSDDIIQEIANIISSYITVGRRDTYIILPDDKDSIATDILNRLEELGIAKNFDERMKDNEGHI